MKKYFFMFLCLIILLNSLYISAEEEIQFVPYISGYDDGTFRPDNTISRAEAFSIVARLSGGDDAQYAHVFDDVNEDDWFCKDIIKLYNMGYLDAYNEFLYPEKEITRGEVSDLIYKFKNGINHDLTSQDMLVWNIQNGNIKGYGDGSYKVQQTISRAEFVTIINRLVGADAVQSDIIGLNKMVFSDVPQEHWAFYNIIKASVNSRKIVSFLDKLPSSSKNVKFDKYNEKNNTWQAVPMVTKELLDSGIKGGEGGQRIMSIAVSADGNFLLCGNDTGGINRSIDGGKTWERCLRGFKAPGCTGISIDPNNPNRALAVGVKQGYMSDINGIYLTEDKGFSWKLQLAQPGIATWFNLMEGVAFDPSSYDEKTGGSTVAYYSRTWKYQYTRINTEQDIETTDQDKKGLWKSTDGGKNWFVVNDTMSDGVVKVDYSNGTVYVANFDGFHRSTDGGVTFEKVLSGCAIFGLDVISTKPGYVYINDYEGLLISSDYGKTFKRVVCSNFPVTVSKGDPDKMVRALKVSPLNPNNMVIASYNGSNYRNVKFYSTDGGQTWKESAYNESKDFFKVNNRHPVFAWSPTDESKVWSVGGDWIASSTDGGKNYIWDYDGGVAVFVDQRTIFNIYNPDIMYYGSQDFHGALTTDGGKTWKHIWKNCGGIYAGFVYGSYAADENTLVSLTKDSKKSEEAGKNICEIKVSRDAGENWTSSGLYITRNAEKKWAEICYQSPNNPNILFAGYYRSDDYGDTWTEMKNINAVYCHNPYGKKELYGSFEDKIMVSYDDGLSWQEWASVKVPQELAATPELTEIWDMSYDGINNIMYYVSGTKVSGIYFCKIQNGITTDLKNNLAGQNVAQLCAVDPRYPNVIYTGGYAWSKVNPYGVQRSVDSGESFQVLTTNGDDSIVKNGIGAGIEPYDLIVNPKTGELWVPQGCSGWVKFAAPYEN